AVDVAGLDQVVGDVGRGVSVKGKAESRAGLCLLKSEVDADHLPGGVEQRPSTVAGVDRCVRLDSVQDPLGLAGVGGIGDLQRAVERADHALGYSVLHSY